MKTLRNYKWVANLPLNKITYFEAFLNELERNWKKGYELSYSEVDCNYVGDTERWDESDGEPYTTMTFFFKKRESEGKL